MKKRQIIPNETISKSTFRQLTHTSNVINDNNIIFRIL